MRGEELYHYGVMGMKWGVRNAETLRRYGLGNADARRRRVLIKTASQIERNQARSEKLRAKAGRVSARLEKKKSGGRYERDMMRASKLERKAGKRIHRGAYEYAGRNYTKAASLRLKYEKKEAKIAKLQHKANKIDAKTERLAKAAVETFTDREIHDLSVSKGQEFLAKTKSSQH